MNGIQVYDGEGVKPLDLPEMVHCHVSTKHGFIEGPLPRKIIEILQGNKEGGSSIAVEKFPMKGPGRTWILINPRYLSTARYHDGEVRVHLEADSFTDHDNQSTAENQ